MATTVKLAGNPKFVPVVITIDSQEDLNKFLNITHAAARGIEATFPGAPDYAHKLNSDVYNLTYLNGSVR